MFSFLAILPLANPYPAKLPKNREIPVEERVATTLFLRYSRMSKVLNKFLKFWTLGLKSHFGGRSNIDTSALKADVTIIYTGKRNKTRKIITTKYKKKRLTSLELFFIPLTSQ
jgi:hypothetical protein